MSTIAQHEVQALFATPYFRVNLSQVITPEQVKFIQNLKMVNNKQNLISENLYIFELPELASIKQAVQDALDIYASEVMGIPQKLYVTQSWSLVNYPNIGMHTHAHSNSIISGSLYYCELPSPASRMIFERFTTHQQLAFSPDKEKRNLYNTPMNAIVPKSHDLLLFSSELSHMVETNISTTPRYSIAFNTFVKGKIGDFRDVSELVL